MNFIFHFPVKIYFGDNMINKVGDEAHKWGSKALVVTGRSSAKKSGALEKVERALKQFGVPMVVFDQVEPNPSTETVEKAAKLAQANNCDVIIALGGGSPMDAAKAIAVVLTNEGRLQDYFGVEKVVKDIIPIIAIPTTAGTGSEVTKYAVITDKQGNQKKIISSTKIYPKVALVDPITTVTMPRQLTCDVGMDALCHAIEGYLSKLAQPISDVLAEQAMQLIATYLPPAADDGNNLEARRQMLYASLLGGITITEASGGLIHGMGYALTTDYHLPHGRANTLLMPWVMEFELPANPPKFARIAEALGEDTNGLSVEEAGARSIQRIKELTKSLDMPTNLKQAGANPSDFPAFAEAVMQNTRIINLAPRQPNFDDLIQIYNKAFVGE